MIIRKSLALELFQFVEQIIQEFNLFLWQIVYGFWNAGKYFLIGLILFWRIQNLLLVFSRAFMLISEVSFPKLFLIFFKINSELLQAEHSPGKDIINSKKIVIKTISTCSEAFYFPNLSGLTINQVINVKINQLSHHFDFLFPPINKSLSTC